MTGGKCARCGAEDSMFWYPYAFGIAPIPNVTDCCVDRSQYFMLCDSCQAAFVNFMQNKGTWFDIEHFKMLMEDDKPMPIITTPVLIPIGKRLKEIGEVLAWLYSKGILMNGRDDKIEELLENIVKEGEE